MHKLKVSKLKYIPAKSRFAVLSKEMSGIARHLKALGKVPATLKGLELMRAVIGEKDRLVRAIKSGRLKWSEDCQRLAHQQGWDVSQNDDGSFSLHALDDPHGVAAGCGAAPYKGRKLNSHSEASAFVEEQGKKGEALALRALAFLRQQTAKGRFFIIGPSGYGKSLGDELHIVAVTHFKRGRLTDLYSTDDYREIDRVDSLGDARKIAAEYGQGQCVVI